MRRAILIVAVVAFAGCGGSTKSGGTGGTGGSSGGGGTAGTGGGGGSGATGGSPADASTDGGFSQCFDSTGQFIANDWKTCTGAGQCSMFAHQTDCCGTTLLIGVATSQLKQLAACEQAWRATFPPCGCASNKVSVEQPSTTVTDQSMATVQCGDFTMTSGICFTSPK